MPDLELIAAFKTIYHIFKLLTFNRELHAEKKLQKFFEISLY
jgi:hypothetical protein